MMNFRSMDFLSRPRWLALLGGMGLLLIAGIAFAWMGMPRLGGHAAEIPRGGEAEASAPAEPLDGTPQELTPGSLPVGVFVDLAAAMGEADQAYHIIEGGSARLASNPQHGIETQFAAEGATISSPQGELQISLNDVAEVEQVTHSAARIEYQRGELIEWYINSPLGLQQGFTLSEAAEQGDQVRVSFEIGGDFTPTLDGDQIILTDSAGNLAMRYSGLLAWDAEDQPLEASMSLDGRDVSLLVDTTDAAYPITIDPIFTREVKLLPSNPNGSIQFGHIVKLDGDFLAIGAPDDNTRDSGAGAVYVFEYRNGSWGTPQMIAPEGLERDDRFGRALDLDGDRLVVSAVRDDDRGENTGAVWIFEYNGSSWQNTGKVAAGDVGVDGRFGYALALDGDHLVVGVRYDNEAGERAGAIYAFNYQGGTWVGPNKIVPSQLGANDRFGVTVAVDGDVLVIGSPGDDDAGEDAGAAYVFSHAGGNNWTLSDILLNPDPGGPAQGDEFPDRFGVKVAIKGDLLAVAAADDNENGIDAGAVYTYTGSPGAWSGPTKLLPDEVEAGDEFGGTLALSSDGFLVVGALGDDDRGADSGAVYLYQYVNGEWRSPQKLVPTDLQNGDQFSVGVSVDAGRLAVGSRSDDDAGLNAGSAYVFASIYGNSGAAPPSGNLLQNGTLDVMANALAPEVPESGALVGEWYMIGEATGGRGSIFFVTDRAYEGGSALLLHKAGNYGLLQLFQPGGSGASGERYVLDFYWATLRASSNTYFEASILFLNAEGNPVGTVEGGDSVLCTTASIPEQTVEWLQFSSSLGEPCQATAAGAYSFVQVMIQWNSNGEFGGIDQVTLNLVD
ncbi:MAG: hypothetical protein GYB68_01470 [Chloroflexi bacterium]|nr:hypothetical protein [Chloroflexota bacterium]